MRRQVLVGLQWLLGRAWPLFPFLVQEYAKWLAKTLHNLFFGSEVSRIFAIVMCVASVSHPVNDHCSLHFGLIAGFPFAFLGLCLRANSSCLVMVAFVEKTFSGQEILTRKLSVNFGLRPFPANACEFVS